MFNISENVMNELAADTLDRTAQAVAQALQEAGADHDTAWLCAERAVELGIDYGIGDTPSLIGIGRLLGTYDAEFDSVPPVLAALTNQRVRPDARVGRILGSPTLLKRIQANIPPGVDRRLKAGDQGHQHGQV